ncbi:MAG: PAS domain S-box protein [Deltaproteobacteria bacterium]|nr:PAS domain S-box protein [Deltaproteobacteria bacterium]
MNLLSVLALFTSFVLLIMGWLSLRTDRKSRLRKTFFLLMLSLGIWAFAYAFVYSAPDKNTAWIYFKISSIGWISFCAFALHFSLALAKREKPLPRRWIPVVYGPFFVFLIKNFTGHLTTVDFIWTSLGWAEVPAIGSYWYYLFFSYYLTYMLFALYFIAQWKKSAKTNREKKQATLIYRSALVVFILGSLVNTVFPLVGLFPLPAMAPIFTLLFAYGVGKAMLKYRLMNITPLLATDQILYMMKDYFILLDAEKNIVSINRQVEEGLGFKQQELQGKPLFSIINPDHTTIFENFLFHETREIELINANGEYLPVLISASEIKDQAGDTIGYALVAQDLRDKKHLEEEIKIRKRVEDALISAQEFLETKVRERTLDLIQANETLKKEIEEKRRAEESLKVSEEKYRLLYENAGDAICTLNDKLEFTGLNKKAEELLGYRKDELIGKNILKLNIVHEDDREIVEKNLRFIAAENKETKGEIRFLRKTGEVRIGDVTSTAYFDRTGNVSVILSIIRDVTEKKQMDEELLKTKKLESIGVLAGGIAHDFNNLLAAIVGNVSLAKMYLDPGEKAFHKLTDAEAAIFKARDLVRKLLLFAKGGEGYKREIDVRQILEDTARLVFSGSPVTYKFDFEDGNHLIFADEDQLRQAINNIMLNAKEAMEGKGTLHVKTESVRLPSRNRFSLEEGDYLKIIIADSGRGIKEEDLPRVFDPYFSTKELGPKKGTGLGLALAYTIVKNHNGHIEIESKFGYGTVVTLYFPLQIGQKKERPTLEAYQAKGKVLIMDDEEMVRNVTKEILSSFGFQVKCAKNGLEAVELYRKAFMNGDPFDLVILDLTVQGGIGGRETLAWIKEIDPDVKAIITSGYTYDPALISYKEYGFVGAITKPFEVGALLTLLENVLGQKRKSGSGL